MQALAIHEVVTRDFDLLVGLALVCSSEQVIPIGRDISTAAAMIFTREIEMGGTEVLQKVTDPPGISTSKLIDPLFGVGQCNEATALSKLLDQRPFITVVS